MAMLKLLQNFNLIFDEFGAKGSLQKTRLNDFNTDFLMCFMFSRIDLRSGSSAYIFEVRVMREGG